jgi:NSS family neurotransmitter:Na+ symporter
MAGVQPGEFRHEHWGSRFGFIMAAIGSSVGLGNFWRFPYLAGENGGGAFVLIYLACVFLLAYPILMAEYALGRQGGLSSAATIAKLARENKKSPNWQIVAWIGGFGAFFILTFYNVIAGWVAAYVHIGLTEGFAGLTAETSKAKFDALTGDPERQLFWMTLFLLATCFVVARGVRGGLEALNSILMPLFFVMLVGMVIFAAQFGDFGAAVAYLYTPDFSKVTFDTVLAALGQACFSIGVGSALMITYGAYLERSTHIPSSSAIVAGSDTLVAMIAGLAIFPILFSVGLDPGGGPGLFFVTLPIAFGQMEFGAYVGAAFFVLALFAAITSSISLMEVAVSWLEEKQGVTRLGATLGITFMLWMIGAAHTFTGAYLDFTDFVTGQVLLPLGAFFIAVFAGWVVDQQGVAEQLDPSGKFVPVWRFFIRFVAPIGVGAIIVGGLGPRVVAWVQAAVGGL